MRHYILIELQNAVNLRIQSTSLTAFKLTFDEFIYYSFVPLAFIVFIIVMIVYRKRVGETFCGQQKAR